MTEFLATMARVEMYSSRWCPYCSAAHRLLDAKGIEYEVYGVDGDHERRAEMEQRSGRYTVPQIFIDDRPVGGFDDIAALEMAGRLDALLGANEGSPD